MFRPIALVAFIVALTLTTFAAGQQKTNNDDQEKHLDIHSSKGDLHVGNDADARKAGFSLYPGARLRRDQNKDGNDSVNLGILSDSFGVQLVVANYESDDAPGKIVEFYREKLGKYGKVLECHSREHGDDIDPDTDNDKDKGNPPKQLTCKGDNTGPVTELKVGTENNQHVVAVEPRSSGGGSTFALVYVHLRGKRGEI
jgi:hypothetical protein